MGSVDGSSVGSKDTVGTIMGSADGSSLGCAVGAAKGLEEGW